MALKRSVFLSDLEVMASIGIHEHELGTTQPLAIGVEVVVAIDGDPAADRIQDTIDYEILAGRIQALAEQGHVNLVETLAERIADLCLSDPRAISARVRVEKPTALRQARAVGVEIERSAPGRGAPALH